MPTRQKWFPEVVEGLRQLPGGPHVLDGEVCVLDDIGRSDFDRLQGCARRRCWYEGCDPVVFCVFDLLAHGGRSLIGEPVERRKALLKSVLDSKPRSVMYIGHFDSEHGASLYLQAIALKLEGLVAKRADRSTFPANVHQIGQVQGTWRYSA